MLSVLLLGAGAGIVGAFPHPQQWGYGGHHKHHFSNLPKYTYSWPEMPTTFPSLPSSSAASGIVPSGYPGTTGAAGTAGSNCVVQYVTVSASEAPSYSAGAPVLSSVAANFTSSAVQYSSSSVAAYSSSSAAAYSAPATFSAATSSSAAASSAPSSSAAAYTSSAAAPASSSAAADSSAAVSAAPVASAGTAAISADSGCTFTDADSAASGKGSCSTIVLSGIKVPAGETLDMTDLNDGTTVQFQGTTTFEYDEWEGPLISFSGKSITITGADGHVIDGNGAEWWDGEGSNGGVTKPKFFYAHDLTDSIISGLNVKNTPVQGFSVNGAENLKIEDVTIDNTAGDTEDGGHNTDCFDVGSSTGVYLSGITCLNQDDCMAINSGTDIQFTGGTCSGGHGLSIGSVGGRDDNDVQDIYIADSKISDSDNGVRIKCNSDTTGSVSNVTYSGITLSGIAKYGIVIEQDYLNGGPTGDPTDGVPITDLTLSDITGSVEDDAQPYYILCAACSDWTVSGVDVTGGSQDETCEGEPSGVSLC